MSCQEADYSPEREHMKGLLTIILLISPALAQDDAARSRAIAACGPTETEFDVKIDKARHPLAEAEAGKALVYVIEDQKTKNVRDVTLRIGLDGAWIGANRGNSYFFFSVDPGVHHLCADWQTSVDPKDGIVALANFTAEAGKVYYYRARTLGSIQDSWLNSWPGQYWVLDLDPVNDDQGKFLVASSRFSDSRAKK